MESLVEKKIMLKFRDSSGEVQDMNIPFVHKYTILQNMKKSAKHSI